MSDITRQQFIDTFAKLREAIDGVHTHTDAAKKRSSLQDVISLCDSFKASCVGYSSALGYAKREAQNPHNGEKR